MAVPLFAGNAVAGDPAGVQGKKNGPPPPDYMGLAQQMGQESRANIAAQTQANRPNQSTPFASSQWSQAPDGQWSQSVGFNGPMGEANTAVQGQLAQALRSPLDFSGLPSLTNGDAARQQAIDAAYSQAESRLNPRFQQQEEALRNRLLASGLQEGSAAYNNAFNRFGQERNDAYNQAQFSAIGQGTQAGQALFNQSLAGRQQSLSEALRARQQPLQELVQMQQFTQMPGFQGAGAAQGAPLLQGAGLADQAALQRWQQQMQMWSDLLGAGGQLGGAALGASDERLKRNVERFGFEAIPGVPAAAWDWAPGVGPEGRQYGVVAQDLQAVRPDLVHEGEDGMLMVDYGGLLGAMG
jgi:hypothetical protein